MESISHQEYIQAQAGTGFTEEDSGLGAYGYRYPVPPYRRTVDGGENLSQERQGQSLQRAPRIFEQGRYGDGEGRPYRAGLVRPGVERERRGIQGDGRGGWR